jgi:hypothetical protein
MRVADAPTGKTRVIEVVDAGFVAVWRGQRVHSTEGGTHYFPTAWDAWMFLGLCDVVEGVPAIAAATCRQNPSAHL